MWLFSWFDIWVGTRARILEPALISVKEGKILWIPNFQVNSCCILGTRTFEQSFLITLSTKAYPSATNVGGRLQNSL